MSTGPPTVHMRLFTSLSGIVRTGYKVNSQRFSREDRNIQGAAIADAAKVRGVDANTSGNGEPAMRKKDLIAVFYALLTKSITARMNMAAMQPAERGAVVAVGTGDPPCSVVGDGDAACEVGAGPAGVPAGVSVRVNFTSPPATRVADPCSVTYPAFSSRIAYSPGARLSNTLGLFPEYF